MIEKVKNITEDLVNTDTDNHKVIQQLLNEINKENLSDLIIIDLLFKIKKLSIKRGE